MPPATQRLPKSRTQRTVVRNRCHALVTLAIPSEGTAVLSIAPATSKWATRRKRLNRTLRLLGPLPDYRKFFPLSDCEKSLQANVQAGADIQGAHWEVTSPRDSNAAGIVTQRNGRESLPRIGERSRSTGRCGGRTGRRTNGDDNRDRPRDTGKAMLLKMGLLAGGIYQNHDPVSQ